MAFKKHTFFKFGYNGFFNGNPETSQMFPFNKAEMNYVDPLHPLAKTCLYKRAVAGYRDMKFIPGIMRSITRLLYCDWVGGPEAEPLKGFGGYGYDTDKNFICEYWDGTSAQFNYAGDDFYTLDYSNDRRIVMKIDKHQRMSAVCIDEYGAKKPYVIQTKSKETDAHSASAAIFALMAYMVSSSENNPASDVVFDTVKAHYDAFMEHYDNWDEQEAIQASHVLANDMYAIFAYNDDVVAKCDDGLDASLYDNPIIPLLDVDSIEVENWTGSSAVFGQAKKAPKVAKIVKEVVKAVKDFVTSGELVLNDKRVLTSAEEEMVPSLDEYIPDKEIITKAQLIKGSTYAPRPFRNLMWEGETGTGKTTAAQILAQVMNLPYTFLTFNPDTLVSDLYVNILPNSKTTDCKSLSSILELAVFNPSEAWQQLTGETKEVTTSEVIQEAIKSSSDFMYVESPLVQAFRYGWLCELQEVNLAMKPGVMGGINAALDDLATIQLPTGEVIHRHPDTVIVMTFNSDYEGTRRLNQAVKSRMTLKGRFQLPEDDVLADRISQNSGLKDLSVIKKMVKVMHRIRKVLNDSGETNGACSVREIQSWAQATDILKDPYQAAMATIVPSASDDPEVIVEVIQQVETEFSPKLS